MRRRHIIINRKYKNIANKVIWYLVKSNQNIQTWEI